ncbi:MAG: class II aldolase/adducin family protein [Verrucomicrobia bacterium]|nr:class II aldolase/adducin family protein [Verrucomicrobiota bacterium]MBI3867816.1 class II aldolase/adducin family protein [Verrucomicrobiota bacterium]
MPAVITAKDIEEIIAKGGDPKGYPADAILTPSAKDALREFASRKPSAASGSGSGAGGGAKLSSKSSKGDLDSYFNSSACNDLKEQLCDIGRRLWQRAYVDGNGGNIAIRVGEDVALCTPTLVSKGFMKPADMCLVDFEGNQLAGVKKRTSEILMHLQIMKRQPRAVATVHCHPPYSTGFAVAGLEPPTCMIPEYEVFSSVAIAPYRTPGTPEMGKLVADLVDQHNTILMANHGVVSWSHLSVEDAYFKMEILEAYCRTVLVTAQLGRPAQTMTPTQLQDLLKIKQSLGIPDPRIGLKECELCDNSEWRPGVNCGVPTQLGTPAPDAKLDGEAEALVKAITDQILGGGR